MGDFVPKPNTANLFFNDVGDNPKRPNWKTIGTVTFNGVEGKVSGWTKTASNGNKFISIVFESNDEYDSKRGKAPSSQNKSDDMPF
tara:strand:- start:12378 stop:12635 length:258 start_codon:yes stop_codon:yes gene_type:complete